MMTAKQLRDLTEEAEFYGILAASGLLAPEQCAEWRQVILCLEELRGLELEQLVRLAAKKNLQIKNNIFDRTPPG